MMWQPGVYATHNKSIPKGWPLSSILSDIKNEVCPNSYIQGLQILAYPGYFVQGKSAASPVYGGTEGGGWGFTAVDAILDALANCPSGRKYFVMGLITCAGSLDPKDATTHYPEFILPMPGQGGVGTDDDDGTDDYPIFQFSSFNAHCPRYDDPDNQAWYTAAMRAYCARYKDNPSYYGVSWNYTPSYGLDVYNAGLYPAWNAYFLQLMEDTRSACPTQMIRTWADYAQPDPEFITNILTLADVLDYTHSMNDTVPNNSASGQRVYVGQAGGVDYRAVAGEPFVGYWSDIEEPEMCGSIGTNTPEQIYARMRTDAGSHLALYPQHIGVWMVTYCPSGSNWNAWKTYLNGLGGATVFDGSSSALRTPAYVKANVCPYSRRCQ
jgi:hypothetical protein